MQFAPYKNPPVLPKILVLHIYSSIFPPPLIAVLLVWAWGFLRIFRGICRSRAQRLQILDRRWIVQALIGLIRKQKKYKRYF